MFLCPTAWGDMCVPRTTRALSMEDLSFVHFFMQDLFGEHLTQPHIYEVKRLVLHGIVESSAVGIAPCRACRFTV